MIHHSLQSNKNKTKKSENGIFTWTSLDFVLCLLFWDFRCSELTIKTHNNTGKLTEYSSGRYATSSSCKVKWLFSAKGADGCQKRLSQRLRVRKWKYLKYTWHWIEYEFKSKKMGLKIITPTSVKYTYERVSKTLALNISQAVNMENKLTLWLTVCQLDCV